MEMGQINQKIKNPQKEQFYPLIAPKKKIKTKTLSRAEDCLSHNVMSATEEDQACQTHE